jgi:ACS family hexuronate transporter-like MFS transporter
MSPPEPLPGIWTALRWRVALLLCLVTTINYLDRQALAVTGPLVVGELGLSNTQFGLVNSAFLLTYAIGHALSGPVIDRYGTRRTLGLAVLFWSLAGMLHAFGRGFWSFLALRGVLGLTEAANFPAALKSVAEWFPRADRSLAVGIVMMGPGLGALIAPPLLGTLASQFGWQSAFLVSGLVGLLWLVVWIAWYRRPEEHRHITPVELGVILAGRASRAMDAVPARRRDLVEYLRIREVCALLLARFANDGAFYFFVTWVPLYLAQTKGFDLRAIAAFAWIPYLAADVGSFAGGWAAQRLMHAGVGLDRVRKRLIWAGALLVPLALPALQSGSASVALAMIAVAMFAIQFKAANLFALPVDIFPANEVGRVWGLFGAVGSFGGMAFVAAVGWLSEHFDYMPVFWAVAVTQLLSAAFISVLIPRIAPLTSQPLAEPLHA